ncbi:MAG: MOSC domain-containing protein YiiM [Sulfurimonas sp.]|jgi:MOSC domain-containing protein YiiM
MTDNTQGIVLELFISIKGKDTRSQQESLIVDTQGVREDKFYAKNTQRAILITSVDSYNLAKENGIETPYSSLGENILLDVNPYHLSPGDRLEVGETLLEISQNCTICKGLSKVDASLPTLLQNDRGIFAKVINGGRISKGDKVIF